MTVTPFRALMGVFAMNAFGFGIWLPRIPDMREALQIDVFTLSLCLSAAPLATIIGLLFSADLEELIGLSDRIVVMYHGELVAELDPAQIDSRTLGSYRTGAALDGHGDDSSADAPPVLDGEPTSLAEEGDA